MSTRGFRRVDRFGRVALGLVSATVVAVGISPRLRATVLEAAGVADEGGLGVGAFGVPGLGPAAVEGLGLVALAVAGIMLGRLTLGAGASSRRLPVAALGLVVALTPLLAGVADAGPSKGAGGSALKITFPDSFDDVSGVVPVTVDTRESKDPVDRVTFHYRWQNTWYDFGVVTGKNQSQRDSWVAPWDTRVLQTGHHQLRAYAYHGTKLVGQSEVVNVEVVRGAPDVVTVRIPDGGATINGTVTIVGNTSGFQGPVAEVVFQVREPNGTWVTIGTVTTPSSDGQYHLPWDAPAGGMGDREVRAVAVAPSGHTAASAPLAVVVAEDIPALSAAGVIAVAGGLMIGGWMNRKRRTT